MVRKKRYSGSATAFRSAKRRMGRKKGTTPKPKTKGQRRKAFYGR